MLSVADVALSFAGFRALDGVSLEAPAGRICGLIGPNGSGKSTLLNIIAGVYAPQGGEVRLDGAPLAQGRPDAVARRGVARTFQIPRLARRLTVMQNMLAGARHHPGERLGAVFGLVPGARARERTAIGMAAAILERLGLGHAGNALAGSLSGGQQKLLSMGVALMAEPRLVLLDEPAAGVNPALIERQIAFLQHLRGEGRIVLLIEHNMEMVAHVCDHVVVLDAGRVIATGTPAEIRGNAEVMRSYLGDIA